MCVHDEIIPMASDSDHQILAMAHDLGLLRPEDVQRSGLRREYLARMARRGLLTRVGRGLYALPTNLGTEQRDLVVVAKFVPKGVICLLSALRFHGLTDQDPAEVWLAMPRPSRIPRLDHPPLRVLLFSGDAYSTGIEHHMVEGVAVKVYSPAKTVADCFKYRNKVGLDVALESLRDYRRTGGSMDDLWLAAKACRVQNVMRPYLEAMS